MFGYDWFASIHASDFFNNISNSNYFKVTTIIESYNQLKEFNPKGIFSSSEKDAIQESKDLLLKFLTKIEKWNYKTKKNELFISFNRIR